MPDAIKPEESDELDTKSESEAIPDSELDDLDREQDDSEDESDGPPDDKPEAEADALTDDDQTTKAVDDIVEKEADTVLASEDAEIDKAFENKPENWKQKIKRLYWQWWNNKKLRYSTLAGAAILILLLFAIPPSRDFILNNVGVRSAASISVFDESTHQPIKNVEVTIGRTTVKTDAGGTASLKHLKLGRQNLVIQKRAFAVVKKPVTLGWGSNSMGNIDIKPVGAQYTFYVTDWLSGKPISSSSASSGEFDATGSSDGKIVLTIDANSDEDLDVTIKAKDYRDETVKLDVSNKAQVAVKMVAGRKSVFVSKRSGKYDVYKVDIDGKNEQLVLAGTGNENDTISLLSHPTDEVAALVSSRDNVHDQDGFLLSTLTILDVKDNSTTSVAQSEAIRLVGWSGDSLVFIQVAAGASAPNPKRERLISYDYKTNKKIELASSNSFNDALLIGGTVYYAPGDLYNTDETNGLYRQLVNGTDKASLLDGEVWNIFRTAYDTLTLSVQQDWYQYTVGGAKATKLPTQPSNTDNRKYLDSPDGNYSLWTEQRDGKGTLLLYDINTKTDKVLKSQAGLQSPLRWLNSSTVVYRIQTPTETADYALSVDGGNAQKIRDVTNTQ